MLTATLFWMVLPTVLVIQGMKVGWNQFLSRHFGELKPEPIWLFVSPISGSAVSFFLWKQPDPHWIAAGCVVGFLANLFYAAVIKRLIFRFSPKARRINILKDRRSRQIRMPEGFRDRRK